MTLLTSHLPPVTMLLIAYNQEGKIREAIAGALAQDYPNLEIVISDDASSDGTFAVIEACTQNYQGPHKLLLHRNPYNLGIGGNISQAVRQSSGELIFITAGDDVSLPERVSTVVDFWLGNKKEPDLIACNLYDMDSQGQIHGVIQVSTLDDYRSMEDWTRLPPRVIGAAQAWTRRLFDQFGGIPTGVVGEDMIMAFRAIAFGRAMTLPIPLVNYRRGGLTQQDKALSVEEVVHRLTRKLNSSKTELQSLLTTARQLNASTATLEDLEKKYQKELFVEHMFSATGFFEKLTVAVTAHSQAIDFRVRIFAYAATPCLLVPFFVLKRWHYHRSKS
ncbi:MAG: glycosyltransferase [Proteobacteria bacterium]|nr:glycosyltransferase [Pseudomonadota bacterium]